MYMCLSRNTATKFHFLKPIHNETKGVGINYYKNIQILNVLFFLSTNMFMAMFLLDLGTTSSTSLKGLQVSLDLFS